MSRLEAGASASAAYLDRVEAGALPGCVVPVILPSRRRGATVLFPLRLDDAVFDTGEAWAGKLRDNRNIGDFRRWKQHDAYTKALERLLRDLRVEKG